ISGGLPRCPTRADIARPPAQASAGSGDGATRGTDVEYALGSGWSATTEYLLVDLGNGSCTTDCAIQIPNPNAVGNESPWTTDHPQPDRQIQREHRPRRHQ